MTEKYEYCSTVPRTFVQDRRSIGFADWFVKDIQNSRQNRSKNKLVCEDLAVTRAHGSCSLWAIVFWFLTLVMIQVTIIKKEIT